jgi:hypothetical protein
MAHRARWGITLALLLGFCVAAQAQESYLDEYVVHVAPGKRAAFDALVKKMAAANRSNQGDNWTTIETTYGPNDTVTFVSGRQSYGDIEKASGVFMGAMVKSMGRPATEKLFEDLSSCATDSHSVLLHRRGDLSSNLPSDPAERNKVVGGVRWIRTTRIEVRFGMGPRFEELAKQVKTAREKTDSKTLVWISQSAAGDLNSVYYVNQLESSLAGFDATNTDIQKILGNDAYDKLLKAASEIIETEETTISHFVPELSNPPEATVNAAPDFWRPKPAAAKPAVAAKPAEAKAPDKK